ncbi:MAG: class I SAM-dependent methyltransferase [Pseudomonadota bacterium]
MTYAKFPAERLVKLSQIESSHFWFKARRHLVTRLLKRYRVSNSASIIDIGCGTGFTMRWLSDLGYNLICGTDGLPESVESAKIINPTKSIVLMAAENLQLEAAAYELALALDVLEHTDDRLASAEVRRLLKPGGVFILTVPAVPSLWSVRDVNAGHLRRYSKVSLTEVLTEAGFKDVWVGYYCCLTFPLYLPRQLIGRNNTHVRDFEESPSKMSNTILSWLSLMDCFLATKIPFPVGASLFAVCRK